MKTKSGEYRRVLHAAFTKHYRDRTDEWTRDPAMRVFPALVQGRLKLPPATRVLDIGCGRGADVDYLAQIFDQVTGIDLCRHDDWAAIAARRRNAAFQALNFLDFEADATFDLVLDNGCLHHQHQDEYETWLRKAAAILGEGGWLALSTFRNDTRREFVDANGRLHRYFTDDELSDLLAAAGFDVIHANDIFRITKGDFYRITCARRR